jgi:hypothetical protein
MVCPPELNGQDPFQICEGLCQTRKTPTLVLSEIQLLIRCLYSSKTGISSSTVRCTIVQFLLVSYAKCRVRHSPQLSR